MEDTRILIASQNPETRRRVAAALREHGFDVAAEALSVQEATSAVGASGADLVVAEAQLPDGGGLELTRWVRQQHPTMSVILLTRRQDEQELFDAIRYGAAAYLPQNIDAKTLVDVIQRVRKGTYVIDDNVLANPALASRVLSAFRELAAEDQQVKPLFVPLSAREIEVLENAARGNSNKQIARVMGISEQTVKNHLTSIMRKLAVNDRTQAVVYALRHGWIRVADL